MYFQIISNISASDKMMKVIIFVSLLLRIGKSFSRIYFPEAALVARACSWSPLLTPQILRSYLPLPVATGWSLGCLQACLP